jgi:hypothetical protein
MLDVQILPHQSGAAGKLPFFIALEESITPPDLWWAAHQRLVGNLVGKNSD